MTKNVLQLAKHLTDKYGTRNPEELCKILGISLLDAELPESVDGFFMENLGRRAIVIRSSLGDIRRTFAVAHELGHALMHKGLNNYFLLEHTNLSLGRYEREADLFAAALLISGEEDYTSDIERLSEESGIPFHTLSSFFSQICNKTA